jgi:hypothetical protein
MNSKIRGVGLGARGYIGLGKLANWRGRRARAGATQVGSPKLGDCPAGTVVFIPLRLQGQVGLIPLRAHDQVRLIPLCLQGQVAPIPLRLQGQEVPIPLRLQEARK